MLLNKGGDVIFTSTLKEPESTRDYHAQMGILWSQLLAAALDAGVHSKDIAIYHKPLHGVDFRELSLPGITLTGCSFRDCDMRGVNFEDADLQDCDFGGARMQSANLEDANLRGASLHGVEANTVRGVIILGTLNSYFTWAYKSKDGELRVRAGCRDFSLRAARRHWKDEEDRDEIYKSLDFIEFMAKRRGWNTETAANVVDDDEDDL